MNKKDFNELIRNYNVPTDSDFRKLKDMVKTYPYSQALHAINARITLDKSLPEGKMALGIAAMYIYDRSILKSYITLPERKEKENIKAPSPQPETDTKLPIVSSEIKQQTKTTTPPSSSEEHELEMDKIREGFIKNLNDLQKNKEVYNKEVKKSEVKDETKKEAKADTPKKKSKKIQKKSTPTKKGKATKTTKKESESPKVNSKKIQENIIDSFIENPPEVKKLEIIPEKETTTEDLSRKSVLFNDDLISENLAVILNNQGKTSKAIDIYKKLIWKYPQKKTYFAARIKELENK